MHNRFGDAVLPDIDVIDLAYEAKDRQVQARIECALQKTMKEVLDKGKQNHSFSKQAGLCAHHSSAAIVGGLCYVYNVMST